MIHSLIRLCRKPSAVIRKKCRQPGETPSYLHSPSQKKQNTPQPPLQLRIANPNTSKKETYLPSFLENKRYIIPNTRAYPSVRRLINSHHPSLPTYKPTFPHPEITQNPCTKHTLLFPVQVASSPTRTRREGPPTLNASPNGKGGGARAAMALLGVRLRYSCFFHLLFGVDLMEMNRNVHVLF